MRRIENRESAAKKQTRNQMIIGFILILLMLLSVLGYGLMSGLSGSSNPNEKVTYNGQVFEINGGLWRFNINGEEFITSYNPKETENIKLNINLDISDYSNQPLYYSSENVDSVKEFLYNIGRYAQRSQEVCLEGEECVGDFVEKNCSSNIIIFKENENLENIEIYKEDNCLFIIGKGEEMVKASNRIIFKLLGIQE